MTEPNTPIAIGYASPDVPAPPGPRLWRGALCCGLLPLTVGLLDIVAWYFTADGWTVSLGFLTLMAGPFIVLTGFIFAAVYADAQRRARIPARRWLSTLCCFGLLFASNFLAAFACLRISAIPPRHTVSVTNASPHRIHAISVLADPPKDLGAVEPGQTRTFHWRNRSSQTSTGIRYVYADRIMRIASVIEYDSGGPEGQEATIFLTPDMATLNGRRTVPYIVPSAGR